MGDDDRRRPEGIGGWPSGGWRRWEASGRRCVGSDRVAAQTVGMHWEVAVGGGAGGRRGRRRWAAARAVSVGSGGGRRRVIRAGGRRRSAARRGGAVRRVRDQAIGGGGRWRPEAATGGIDRWLLEAVVGGGRRRVQEAAAAGSVGARPATAQPSRLYRSSSYTQRQGLGSYAWFGKPVAFVVVGPSSRTAWDPLRMAGSSSRRAA
ncbi:hypothetical protein GUJ93_ZPchr0026g29125 [Zizania palustris]|uniref:Uncharacterized protein n=1 Tax=Zizania palustris TaxID=103762 RepID=A0A8J5V8I8_ZIZPA|nr:hypothetical protein GUJ93_ZPchr0026g29125 [Zizania palustris]